MQDEVVREYDTALDTKHRITVRGEAKLYKNYHVRVFNNGRIVLDPRVLIDPKLISKKTLRMMDKSMCNYQKGIRSEPLNTDEMRRIADALPD